MAGLLVVGCGALIKPPPPSRRLDVHTSGTTFAMDRGYRFVVLPEPGAQVVRLDVRYPVGASDDPVGKEGLAHLAEHLLTMVELGKGEGATTLDGELGRVALSYNAYTEADATTYLALARPAALDDLLRLEAARLKPGCAGIPRAMFEREREVVRNELRQHGGDAGADLRRQLHEAVYPEGHPYRRIDSPTTVAAITYEDVCAFVAATYRRGPALVAISGAVDEATVKAAVARHFATVPRRQDAAPRAIPAATPRPGTQRVKGDVDEPLLLATWPLPPMTSRDYRLLEIAWGTIAGNLERYAFTYKWGHSATASVIGGPAAPVLVVGVTLNRAADLGEARARVGSAVNDAFYTVARPGEERTSPVWTRLWEREAAWLLARWESLAGRNALGLDMLVDEASGSIAGRVRELAQATPTGVRELAETWLDPARARFLLVEPSGTSGGLRGGAFTAIVDAHGTEVDPALADAPLPAPPPALRAPAERYELGNGLRVVLWPHGRAPVVHGRLVIDAGAADDPFGMEGVAQLVGASDVYADGMVFDERRLGTRVDDLIAALAVELREPGYGLSDAQQEHLLGRLATPRAEALAAYQAELLLALYGEGHPYARSAITADGVRRLSQDKVQGWARRHVAPRNATLVLAGAFDAALVRRHVAYNAEHVGAGARPADVEAAPRTTPEFIAGIAPRASATVALAAHFVGGRGLDADHAARLVLEAVVDARLTRLRQVRALTYGFSAAYAPRKAGGLWTIGGEVDARRAAEAGAQLVAILDELRRDPETYRAEFVLARQKVLERLLVQSTSAADAIERLALAARFGGDDDLDAHLARKVAALTLATFHPFLARELSPRRQVIGAFGDAGAVREALSAAETYEPPASPAP